MKSTANTIRPQKTEITLEALEDEGLRRAMQLARSEKPLSRKVSLKKLAAEYQATIHRTA